MARRAKIVAVKISYGKVAGGGAFAKILHDRIGAVFHLRLQLKAGRVTLIRQHALMIDALFFQLLVDEAAKSVIAYAADPAHFQTEPREADSDIQFRSGDAFDKGVDRGQIAGFGGDEHRHRFADSDHIQRTVLVSMAVHDLLLAQQIDIVARHGNQVIAL